MEYVLKIVNLAVSRRERTQLIPVINDINFFVEKGELFCLVGESGSGKTTLALSIMRLLPKSFVVTSGEILLNGQNILNMNEQSIRSIRGKDISIIFQDPGAYLDPLFTVGVHLQEALHGTTEDKNQLITKTLKDVGLEPEIQLVYPHQISGGQQQRVMIAMALINNPSIIIADEPTTALDVLTTRQIINLLSKIREKYHPAIFFITHDLELAMSIGIRIGIMYKGHIVEIFRPDREKPLHPYSGILLGNIDKKYFNEKIPVSSQTDINDWCPFFEKCPEREQKCQKKIPFIWHDSLTGIRCIKHGRTHQM